MSSGGGEDEEERGRYEAVVLYTEVVGGDVLLDSGPVHPGVVQRGAQSLVRVELAGVEVDAFLQLIAQLPQLRAATLVRLVNTKR